MAKGQGKGRRGFAAMDPNKQRQIASEGGKAAHRKGTAHEFTSEEARMAGSKGGQAGGKSRSKSRDQSESQTSDQNSNQVSDWYNETDDEV